ncbi:MAG: (d)CMP kinase, partial [Spirochaetaceae bacterium]|nr:(d)CMP kinase [Spirochaetaceae bacterium]
MVVAIDGPAGAGKSTIAKEIAKRLNITFLNSGSFYRAITLSLLASKVNLDDEKAVIDHAAALDIDYVNSRLILNGVDVEDKLHTDEIDANASKVSSYVEV